MASAAKNVIVDFATYDNTIPISTPESLHEENLTSLFRRNLQVKTLCFHLITNNQYTCKHKQYSKHNSIHIANLHR